MQAFSEYIAARHGSSWCVATRKTPALLARYGTVIPRKQYQALELAWEIETYGAPLKSLEAGAPALLAALRELAGAIAFTGVTATLVSRDIKERHAAALAAILKAGGKPVENQGSPS